MTLKTPRRAASTHLTGRAIAKASGLSLRTIQRIWADHKLQPHRVRTFKRATDPDFAAKLDDVVGFYIDPPRHAVVFLHRREEPDPGAQPYPAWPAAQARQMRDDEPRLQTQRHDHAVRRARYDRREKSSSDASRAISIRSSSASSPRSSARFRLGRSSTPSPTITPRTSTPEVKTWLADHPRWTLHSTPTSLLLAERRGGVLLPSSRGRASGAASFDPSTISNGRSVATLPTQTKTQKPFVWTASAQSIRDKTLRRTNRLSQCTSFMPLLNVAYLVLRRPKK